MNVFKHFHSKKFSMCAFALMVGFSVHMFNMWAVIKYPESATYLVGMFNTVMSFVGAVAGTLLCGQSFVDWKMNASTAVQAVSTVAEITRKTVKAEHFDDLDE